MSKFDLPENFTQLVAETYEQAFKDGEVVFSESQSEYFEDNNTQFVLSLLSGLAKKPTQEEAPEQVQRPKDFNPFLNPDPKLTVLADYGDEFNILLNKFPITPNHILLTTKQFKSQSSPLTENELVAGFKILKSLEKGSTKNEKFFGFYNCGENAGASQPHKHLQFLKYPDNFIAFPTLIASAEEAYIANSRKEPLQNKNLPFAHFVLPLPSDEKTLFEEDYLSLAFSSLLQRTLTILRDAGKPIGYNVIFTSRWILLVPRSDGYYKEKLGINSAGFTGLLLAKNEELRDLIKNDGALNILSAVGFPNTADEPTDEYHY